MTETHLPKVLLFDLGGVVVPWVGMEALAAFNGLTRAEVSDRFDGSEIFRAFERGHASHAEFADELRRLFDLPDSDVPKLWNSWVKPPFPGVLNALADLKTRFTTACLSNTNDLHWTHLNAMFSTSDSFHHAFASHEIREAKPDAASYLLPLERMGVSAKDVWFFEDTTANVEAARALGIQTFQVNRAEGVMPVFQELGLVP